MSIECPVSIECPMLTETKAVWSLWHVEDGNGKHGGNLYVDIVILQVVQGQSEWKIISAIMFCNMGRGGCRGVEIKWEGIVNHGLIMGFHLDLKMDKLK